MKNIKKQKLYFRNEKGSIQRVDKISVSIYGFIVDQFYNGNAQKRYMTINKDVKEFKQYVPIQMIIPRTFQNDFKILQQAVSKKSKVTMIKIAINGNRPLCDLKLADIVQESKPE